MSDLPFPNGWARIEANVRARGERRARERAQREALRTAEYRPALVSFLDILGFRNLVESQSAAEVGRILAALQVHHNRDGEEERSPETGEAGVITFSDSIVRVVPVQGDHRTGALFHELHALALAQAELALQGVFLRGGMAFGDVVFDGRTIYGPALVRAYTVESTRAVHPRIMLDPGLLETYAETPALWGDDHDLRTDFGWVRRYLHEDEDGVIVDYLRAIAGNLDPGVTYDSVMSRHRERVIAASAEVEDARVKAKYDWVARYHNAVIDGRRDRALLAPLRIGPEEL